MVASITEDSVPVTNNLTVTDDDPGSSVTFSIEDLNGDYGILSISTSNGVWTYTPSENMISTLVEGQVATDNFIAVATDDLNGIVTDNISIIISGINDAPVIESNFSKSGTEDDSVIMDTIVISDIDTVATASFVIENPTGNYGVMDIGSVSGLWVYTLSDSASSLDAGDSVTDNFIVTVTDDQNATVTENMSIALTGLNDRPVIDSGVTVQVTEDVAIVTDNIVVIEPDQSAILNFALTNPTGNYGVITVNATTGNWEYTMIDTMVNPLNNGDQVQDTFTLTVTDDQSASDTKDLIITIDGVNDASIISGTPDVRVNEDSAYSFTPVASDIDNSITFSAINVPSWATLNTTTGELFGTPINEDVGHYIDVVIRVNDDIGNTVNLSTFNIEVVNTNDTPVISGVPITNMDQNSLYEFTPTSNDVDLGDILTFSITNQPSWAVFETTSGTLSGTPVHADVGIYSDIVITVTDLNNESVSLATFNITINDINDFPTISGAPADYVRATNEFKFVPIGSDVDGDVLTYSINNQPSWASFNNATTGEFAGIPEDDIGYDNNILISVSDGNGGFESLATFNIEVKVSNTDPTIVGTPATDVNEDESYSFVPVSEDADGDDIQFNIENRPSWANFNINTGELSGLPENKHVGVYSDIIISVTDGMDAPVKLPTFNITVVNVNDLPIITGTPNTSVDEGSTYSFIPISEDDDVNDVLTYSIGRLLDMTSYIPQPDHEFNFRNNVGASTIKDKYDSLIVATLYNGAVATEEGLVLDGINDFVKTTAWRFGGNMTVEMYMKLDDLNSNPSIFDFTTGTDSYSVSFSKSTTVRPHIYNMLNGTLTEKSLEADQAIFSENNWVHVVWSITDTTWEIYNNGTLNTTSDSLWSPDNVTRSSHFIGRSGSNDNYFNGTIAYIRFWHGDVLTADQVATLYESREVESLGAVFATQGSNVLPSWATFNDQTGELSGVPLHDDVDEYTDILITVSDGSGGQ